jgi:hypothetical protein
MRFDVPKIDTNLKLLEADPFKLIMQTENSTCIVKYTGPSNAIVSGKDGCTYAANIKMHATHDLVLAPGSGCEKINFESETRHFGVDRCDQRKEHDEKGFVQITNMGQTIFIALRVPSELMEGLSLARRMFLFSPLQQRSKLMMNCLRVHRYIWIMYRQWIRSSQ